MCFVIIERASSKHDQISCFVNEFDLTREIWLTLRSASSTARLSNCKCRAVTAIDIGEIRRNSDASKYPFLFNHNDIPRSVKINTDARPSRNVNSLPQINLINHRIMAQIGP